MPETTTEKTSELNPDKEWTARATVAGWTAGVSVFFLVSALVANPVWPVAAGVAGISVMVAAACYFILQPRCG